MKHLYILISLLITLTISTSLLAQTSTPPSNYGTSTGLSDDPYFISSLDNLYWLSQTTGDWDKCFEQTADIDASATSTWNGGAGWDPIGYEGEEHEEVPFTGSYDGNGHTIDQLFINHGDFYTGLFGTVDDGTIKNLGIKNANVTGNAYVGALVGKLYNNSIVENCYSTGSVTDLSQVTGGLVGSSVYNTTISNCYSTCDVTGTWGVGGFVGDNSNTSTVENCYSTGNVTRSSGSYTAFGAFCGSNSKIIRYCYSMGNVSCGGLTNKGFVGESSGSPTYTDNFWNSEASNQSSAIGATAKNTTQMQTQSTFTNWDFTGTTCGIDYDWEINSTDNDGYPHLCWQEFPVTEYYYRSSSNGDWSEASNWQQSIDEMMWEDADEAPTAENSLGIILMNDISVDIDLSVDQMTSSTESELTIPSGKTLTVADGDGTDLTINGTLDMDGGTLTMNGSLEYGALSTLEYSDASGAQTTTASELPASGCANLTILNSNGVTLNSSTSISGDLFVNTGCLFAIGDNNFTTEGTSDFNGTLSLSTGTYDANGAFDASGGAVTFTDAATLELGGSATSLGTFTSGTGTVTYSGADQTIVAGSSISYNNLSLTGSGTKTATDALIATNLLTSNNNFNVALNGDGTTITNKVEFLNTGSLTLGNAEADVLTFTGGVEVSDLYYHPSSITLQGTIKSSSANNAVIKLFPCGNIDNMITISGNTTINPVGNEVRIGNITINNGKTLTVGTGNTGILYFDGTVDSESDGTGHLTINTNTITPLGGNFGSTTPLGTITLTNGMVQAGARNITAGTLQINGGSFGFTPSRNWDINNVTIASGATLNATTGSFGISGNWSNAGTFNHKNGTVTFDGSSISEISGSTEFYNFTCTTAGKTLKFDSDDSKSQTISNNFYVNGTSGNPVIIASTTPGDASEIVVNNSILIPQYVDVTDSHNSGNTIFATNSTDGGNNQGWYFGLASDYIWAGRTNSDWNTAINWGYNEVPDEITDNVIIIDQDNDPIISSGVNANCNNLTINSGGILTIQSTSEGTGSLIVKGALTNNGTINVQRYIPGWRDTDHGWHFLSSPVTSQAISSFHTAGSGNDFYKWNEPTNEWINRTTSGGGLNTGFEANFELGTGYLIANSDNSTKIFSGNINVNDVPVSGLSNTETSYYKGSNLLGNPFTSALKWNDGNWSLGTTIADNCQIWDEENAGYSVISPNGYIPAMNGFMVYTSSDNGTLTIPKAAQTHEGNNWMKNDFLENESVVLKAVDEAGQTAQESIIRFDMNASKCFDLKYDSYFIAGFAPMFYSISEQENYALNTLPKRTQDLVIPMGFVKNGSSEFYIELTQNMDDLSVYLIDKKTDHVQKLNESDYHFYSEEGDNVNRFEIRFGVVGIDEPTTTNSTIQLWSANNNIYLLNSNNLEGHVKIINMYGQNVLETPLNREANQQIKLDAPAGYYIVNVFTENGITNKKVYLK